MRKLFTDVISIQAENKSAISDDLVNFINKHYKTVIYFGDNDTRGIDIGNLFKDKFNFQFIYFPEDFKSRFGIKDIADFVKKWGLDYYIKYLKCAGVIKESV
jgi:hypothetical protein